MSVDDMSSCLHVLQIISSDKLQATSTDWHDGHPSASPISFPLVQSAGCCVSLTWEAGWGWAEERRACSSKDGAGFLPVLWCFMGEGHLEAVAAASGSDRLHLYVSFRGASFGTIAWLVGVAEVAKDCVVFAMQQDECCPCGSHQNVLMDHAECPYGSDQHHRYYISNQPPPLQLASGMDCPAVRSTFFSFTKTQVTDALSVQCLSFAKFQWTQVLYLGIWSEFLWKQRLQSLLKQLQRWHGVVSTGGFLQMERMSPPPAATQNIPLNTGRQETTRNSLGEGISVNPSAGFHPWWKVSFCTTLSTPQLRFS